MIYAEYLEKEKRQIQSTAGKMEDMFPSDEAWEQTFEEMKKKAEAFGKRRERWRQAPGRFMRF